MVSTPRYLSSREANVSNEQGFALLSVLWLLLLATVLVASLAFWTTQSVQTRSLLSQELEAKRILYTAFEIIVFDLITNGRDSEWVAQSGPVTGPLDILGTRVDVTVSADAGKVDINAADDATILLVLKAAGASESKADTLLFKIHEAQKARSDLPKLATMREVQSVFRDANDDFACVEPLITVHTGAKRPLFEKAPPNLQKALGPKVTQRSVMSIAAQELTAQVFRLALTFEKRTVAARVLLTGDNQKPYWLYSWSAFVSDCRPAKPL